MDKFTKISFKVNRKENEIIEANIYDYQNLGIEIEDPEEMRQLLSELPEWELTDMEINQNENIKYSVFFESNEEGKEELNRFIEFLENNISDIEYSIEKIDNSNWEDEWKKSYKSFEIGHNILIKPSWEEAEETDRIIIEIDPKMAFGTGTHETTSLIMEAVELFDLDGLDIIDIGCGSGILSILAKKLGAKNVDACDIDEIAIESAKENSRINNVEINPFLSNLFSNVKGKYDIIFANILAEILVDAIKGADEYLKEDGIIFLSGIIREKEELILLNLEKYDYQVIDIIRKGEWTLISARRKDA